MIFRNTKKVVSTNRVEMKRNLLLIAEVNSEDNGVYHCLGKNAAGSSPVAMTFPLIVPSNDTATLRVAPQKVTVKRGDSATFSCVFDNVDRVQWYFEDRGPLESDDERSVFDNGTLVVLRAEDRDRGVYSCHGVRADSAVIYTTELHIACDYSFKIYTFFVILDSRSPKSDPNSDPGSKLRQTSVDFLKKSRFLMF